MSHSATSLSTALSQLLPSTPQLPPKLIQKAQSLLAQSRLRAANLKPEEEIARPYACAEIACQRLRTQLRLPANLKGRPPCKPAVYKKLLRFLDGLLVADEGGDTRPAATTPATTPKKRDANGALKMASASANTTPSKTPKKGSDFVGKVLDASGNGRDSGEAPQYLPLMMRRLCLQLKTPEIYPHAYTGICVALKLAKLWPRHGNLSEAEEVEANNDITSLSIALYLLVLTRMKCGPMTPELYKKTCGSATKITAFSGPGRASADSVEQWIKTIQREGYCDEEGWWGSVPEHVIRVAGIANGLEEAGGELAGSDEAAGGNEDDDDGIMGTKRRKDRTQKARRDRGEEEQEEDDPEGVLLPGLGTMMQDAVDWLSEERRLDYLEWKESILSRIKPPEARAKALAVR